MGAGALAREDPFMPESHQLTLDLFDSTARASGWTLDVPRPAVRTDEPVKVPTDRTAGESSITETSNGPEPAPRRGGHNYYLAGDRELARSWLERSRDNIAAIELAARIEREGRAATPAEQAQLIRFVGFGASDLANGCFRRPGDSGFRAGWEAVGEALEQAVMSGDYASLARCTQYAHYTPEYVVRAIWRALERMGFRGGSILEPGVGTGLFLSLLPEPLRARSRFTGIEYDAVTARIARLLHPEAEIRHEDFGRAALPASFDLAIGNPPFSDRIVRSDPDYRALGLRLHDFFIAKAIDRLKPGGLAAFVTSHGTMDKADPRARARIAASADLIGAIRLPEGSFRAAAGTDVVVDVLFFRKRRPGDAPGGAAWETLAEVRPAAGDSDPIRVNRYFREHPEMVLGEHGLRRGIYGAAETYTCRPQAGVAIEDVLARAIERLPADIYDGEPEPIDGPVRDDTAEMPRVGTAADGATIKEGSYFIGADGALMQILDGAARPVAIKRSRDGEGIFAKHARIIRGLIPIRDAVRAVLRAQEANEPWADAQVRLRVAYSTFTRSFGPINLTTISSATDPETGEVTETHRRPNLQPFLDDPDCWLVASIEEYDLETGTARPGAIFSQRVIAPPQPPLIASAADALAVVLNEQGRVDLDHIAELLHRDRDHVLAELGEAVFRNPVTDAWETADDYLSGPVRSKLAAAEAAAALDPAYGRNVTALRRVQPEDLRPSDITARLGAPWIPADVIEAFAAEVMGTETRVRHTVEIASWSIETWRFAHTASGTTEWGTHRRHAGLLLSDALNASIPQIFDTIDDNGTERRVLNTEATEAAKEKLTKIKAAFQSWVWTCADRTDRLARLYNDRFNNLVPRHFDGTHLNLPGASSTFRLYDHQKRVIWRIVAAGSTYIAHAVGAGKTLSIAAVIMEQKRLGLISKAMLVVPGHCLAQASREFLALYPNARILVADETNFVREKRQRFLARAATATWDAIIITHSAFRFIPVPATFEQQMIHDQLQAYEALLDKLDSDDRLTRKRIERLKEGYQARLEALGSRKDDLLTLAEIGIDQIVVDEAQEFRKLSFATNMTSLKGVDPQGSQRAWDLSSSRASSPPSGSLKKISPAKPAWAARSSWPRARRSPTRSARCSRCSASCSPTRWRSAACTSSTPGPRRSAIPGPSSSCSPPGATGR
jgi:N12 class adenine-specific DNA methylase/adenine-specific DNA methylase